MITKAAIFVAVAATVQFLVPPFAANVHSTAALATFGARDPGSAMVGKVVTEVMPQLVFSLNLNTPFSHLLL
jgi:hypothetical protein